MKAQKKRTEAKPLWLNAHSLVKGLAQYNNTGARTQNEEVRAAPTHKAVGSEAGHT